MSGMSHSIADKFGDLYCFSKILDEMIKNDTYGPVYGVFDSEFARGVKNYINEFERALRNSYVIKDYIYSEYDFITQKYASLPKNKLGETQHWAGYLKAAEIMLNSVEVD
jgi:hypothetical protein